MRFLKNEDKLINVGVIISMNKINLISVEELKRLVANSKTYTEILKHFNLENRGGNHLTLKRRLVEENIDYSHLKSRIVESCPGIFKSKYSRDQIINKYFVSNNPVNWNSQVRTYLKRFILIPYVCSECQLKEEWNNKKIILELDHIDGDPKNNVLNNLRWLCPNCHSQTSNFRGRKNKKMGYCQKCNKQINKLSKHCRSCAGYINNLKNRKTKTIRPNKEELEKLLWIKPTTKIAKDFNVSDVTIKKWAKQMGIINHPRRGYWRKEQTKKLVEPNNTVT
jgi:hypothetical protein